MGAEFVSIDAQFFGKKFDDDLNGTLEEFNLNFSSFISAPRSTRSVQISDFKLGLEQSIDLIRGGLDTFMKRIATGDDEFIGSSGDDIMRSYAGDDLMEGGDGDDFLTVDGGKDTVRGGEGDDLVLADTGNDMVFGGAGDDAVFSGAGNDDVDGGDGSDFLALSGGNDTAIGGGGKDTFAFKNNSGDDVVRDFQAGKDILDLSRARDIDDFSDLIANHVDDVRGDLIIAVSGSSDVTLEGVQIVDLNEGDFIF